MHFRILAASLVLAVATTAVAQDKAPFTAERSWQIQRIGAPTISPDGAMIIAAIDTPSAGLAAVTMG